MAGNIPLQQNGPRWTNAEQLTLLIRTRQANGTDSFTAVPSVSIPVARRQQTAYNIIQIVMLTADETFVDFVIWNGDGQGGTLSTPPRRGYRLQDSNGVQYEIRMVRTPHPYTFRVTALVDR